MKIRFVQKRKLKAATATMRPRGMSRETSEGQEPNISFGRAIIVVVVLHLVAVIGICVFSSLKARRIAMQQQQAAQSHADPAANPSPVGGDTAASRTVAQDPPQTGASAPVASTPAKLQAAAVAPVQNVKTVANASASSVKDSGELYTVAKGDTPVSIAKKLHVNYDDLLKLNKISDPKKLKIGQKLRIPVKKKATSTTQTPVAAPDEDDEQMS
ncbi:MAG TPA: LysM peptidoglycan-binding domain-containing protein [Chthoniobacteraceae bacterium]|nr:LysM peptidoglycan-binding domain-containing protein [Chthoniobacteraceae bacterium]